MVGLEFEHHSADLLDGVVDDVDSLLDAGLGGELLGTAEGQPRPEEVVDGCLMDLLAMCSRSTSIPSRRVRSSWCWRSVSSRLTLANPCKRPSPS